ncbi:MAG: cyclic nucleotide-binding domain-containing protein [Actinomycetota bacterium]
MVERLSRNLIPVTAGGGEVVIREGDPGDRFYLIEDGAVAVTAAGRHVADLGPGDFFGEIALLRDAPRNATVTAGGPVKLLVLERAEFLDAVTGSRAASQAADRAVDHRLAETAAEAPHPAAPAVTEPQRFPSTRPEPPTG